MVDSEPRPVSRSCAFAGCTATFADRRTGHGPAASGRAAPAIGSVLAVNGAQATVGLMPTRVGTSDEMRATVGKFLCIPGSKSLIIGLITDVSVEMPSTARDKGFVATAKLDLMGEIMP